MRVTKGKSSNGKDAQFLNYELDTPQQRTEVDFVV